MLAGPTDTTTLPQLKEGQSASIIDGSQHRLFGMHSQLRSHSTEKGHQLYSRLRDEEPKTATSVRRAFGFIPRSGIELPFLAERPRFIETHKEFEPVHTCSPSLADDYLRQDNERLASQLGTANKIVYDCIDPSPFYESQSDFINEADLVVPQDLDPVEQKRYLYGQPPSSNFSTKGTRLNRFYSRLNPYYVHQGPDDATLVFESRFECGNLRRAVQVGEYEYDLILKYDYGTSSYTQWYFFRVGNTRKDVTYKFNVINLMKPESSYNQGQKPLLYSKKEAAANAIGWYRDGQNISYYQNHMKRKGGGSYHTLTF